MCRKQGGVFHRGDIHKNRTDAFVRCRMFLRLLEHFSERFSGVYKVLSLFLTPTVSVLKTDYPERSEVFNQSWRFKTASFRVSPTLTVAPIKTSPPSAYRIDLKKYYAPGNTNLGSFYTGTQMEMFGWWSKKIRPKKCLTRTKSTSTGPIRLGTEGMRWPRCGGRG